MVLFPFQEVEGHVRAIQHLIVQEFGFGDIIGMGSFRYDSCNQPGKKGNEREKKERVQEIESGVYQCDLGHDVCGHAQ